MKQFKQFPFCLFQHYYSLLKDRDLLVSIIGNKLKVFYSVIIPDVVLMVNYFPTMEIPAKMFRYYKAMFKNIMTLICHRVKEIVRIYIDHRITVGYTSSPFPARMFSSTTLNVAQPSAITYIASLADRTTFINCNPPFPFAIRAGKPLEFPRFCRIPYFLTSFNITNFIHTYIIPYKKALGKGAI